MTKQEVACSYCGNYIYYPDEAEQGYHNRCHAMDFGTKQYNNQIPENNPQNEPIGHFTGRCSICGSNNLWNDNLHYGCNLCGALLA